MSSKRSTKKARRGTSWATPSAPLTVYRDGLREALGRSGKTLAAMRRALNAHGASVLDEPDEQVWVWSDLHLGHANIIEYQGRPHANVQRMDADLWLRWQETAAPDRTLVCVGDVALGEAACDATWDRIASLPGSQVLVVGNHDLSGSGRLRAQGFRRVKALLTSPGTPPLLWTHAPLPDVPAGHVNVHGHRHGLRSSGPRINVSVEQLDYRPIRLDRLRRLAAVLVAGEEPPGATTLEQVRHVEGAA